MKLPKDIITKTAEKYGLSPEDMLSRNRDSWYVRARRETARKLRNELGLSYIHIGKLFNRHHATIIQLVKRSGWLPNKK